MKAPLLSLTLVLLFVAPVFAQADHREVDLRIRGVGSGSSESHVLATVIGMKATISGRKRNQNLSEA